MQNLFFLSTIQYNQFIMSYIMNRIIRFLHNLRLEETEPYPRSKKGNTLIQSVLKVIRNMIRHLSTLDKDAVKWMLVILGIIVAYVWWKFKRQGPGPPPESPRKQGIQKQTSMQRILKKNTSLLSMRQYESHSHSGSESDSQSYNKSKQTTKKLGKEFKDFCTDIETEPQNGKYEAALEQKRDKFFFTLMGSLQHSKPKDTTHPHQQLDYECEYEESEMSPRRVPVPKVQSVGELERSDSK